MSSPRNSPAAPRPRRKPRAAGIDLQVDPADLELKCLTWWDWLREVRYSGGVGFTVSLVLHVAAVLLMAWFIVDWSDRADDPPYLVTWLDPAAIDAAEKTATPVRQPVTLPLSIASAAPTVMASQPPPKPQPEETSRKLPVNVAEAGDALRNRSVASRGDLAELEKLGGSAAAQRAIKAGLAWLARQQTSAGHWELHQGYPDAGSSVIRTDTGATALALLAFLGAGQTHRQGEHAGVISKGLVWLIDTQDPVTGDLHDQRQEEGRQPAFYAHAMATIALCEALALTGDETLREPAEKAVRYLLAAQHPQQGGWKYRPISQLMIGDLSVTGWALMALHTARMAGIDVSPEEFERASAFLDSVSERSGSRYKYEPHDPPQRVTVALTAEGLLCRQWFGWPRDDAALQNGVTFLLDDAHRPEWSAGRRNVYGWYYTAQVLHNLGGEPWETWYPRVRDLIVQHQMTGGSARSPNDVRGSWHPMQPPGMGEEYADKAGRLYVTALCLLILETPVRHQPLYPPAGDGEGPPLEK